MINGWGIIQLCFFHECFRICMKQCQIKITLILAGWTDTFWYSIYHMTLSSQTTGGITALICVRCQVKKDNTYSLFKSTSWECAASVITKLCKWEGRKGGAGPLTGLHFMIVKSSFNSN